MNWVDSWLFLVRSQIGSLTPGPSFGHNLCFRCLNEQCEPILDIYVSRAFQWYEECHKSLNFDPSNCSLKFWESTGTPSPKVGVVLGVWMFTPSHFLTLPGVCDVTPRLPLGPQPCNVFALIPGLPLGPQPCNAFALTPGLPFGPQPCNAFALTPGLPLALTLGLPLGPQLYNPFALVASPKLGLRHEIT